MTLITNEYGFVTEFTYPYPITYDKLKIWRNKIPAAFRCEIGRCGNSPSAHQFVYDHCHKHGTIRGMLCQRHNSEVISSNPIKAKWRNKWLARCPLCVHTLLPPALAADLTRCSQHAPIGLASPSYASVKTGGVV